MKENKSIDGLATRGSKKSAAKSSSASKSTGKTTGKTSSKPATKAASTAKPTATRTKSTKTPVKKPAKLAANSNPGAPKTSFTITDETIITESTTTTDKQTVDDFLSPVSAFDFDADTKELTAINPSEITKPHTDTMKDDNLLSDPPKKSKKAKKTKKKPSKARRIITIILLIIVLSLIGLVTWGILWGNDIIAKITGGQGNVFDLFTFVDETYEPLKTGENGRTNILAFGTSGFNMDGEGFDGVHDGADLTDSIMIISLNQDTGDIAMLSLPRDLKASPTCTATGKINEVYWCNNMNGNNEQAGAEALMAEVGYILGLDFQYYAHVNWGSLESIVDTLGGITITLDEDISDYYYTGATFKAGVEYTINGEQALGLARARHGTIGGDFSRGASQQKILIGIKNRVFEKHLSITDLLSLASTLGDNLRTNFSVSDMKTLAHLTQIFDFDSMRQISLVDYDNGVYYMTTATINGISYVVPAAGVGNYTTIRNFVADQLSSDPRHYEAPTILVLNATDTPGLATAEVNALLAEGYTDVTADDAPDGDYYTGITLYAINSDKPGTQQLLETYYWTDAHSADELPAGIPSYYDFIIIVNPAHTSDDE